MGLFDKFLDNNRGSKAFEKSIDDEKIRKQAERDRIRKERGKVEEQHEEEDKRQQQKKDDLFPWEFVNKKDDKKNDSGWW
jgi:hypothetical protein